MVRKEEERKKREKEEQGRYLWPGHSLALTTDTPELWTLGAVTERVSD